MLLTHVTLWKSFVDSFRTATVILEDDVTLLGSSENR